MEVNERFAPPANGGPAGQTSGPSMLSLASMFLRHLRLLVVLPAVAFLIGAVGAATLGRGKYAAESTFIAQAPQGRSGTSQLAGLAAQFGVSVGGGGSTESPEFYAALLKSRGLLEAVAEGSYPAPGAPGGRATLVEILDIEAESEAARATKLIDRLDRLVSTKADLKSGLVLLQTVAPDPQVAEEINRRLLDQLISFNLVTRQSQARSEREFVEERLEEAQAELQEAEVRLTRFLEQNQSHQAPTLALRFTRLQRQLDMKQQVYSSLAQAYEQARIDEVRNTPVITVVEAPEGSARAQGRSPLATGIIFAVVAGLFAVGLVFLREYIAFQHRRDPESYAEFRALVNRAVPLPRIRRRERTSVAAVESERR